MMEFSGLLSESVLLDLIDLANESIQPILEMQQKMHNSDIEKNLKDDRDDELRKQLGLSTSIDAPAAEPEGAEFETKANQMYDEAIAFVDSRLGDVTLRLFGARPEEDESLTEDSAVGIHSEDKDGALFRKVIRGRRETIIKEEIERLLAEFEPSNSELSTEYHGLLQSNKSVLEELASTIHSKLLRKAMTDASIQYKSRADGRGTSATIGSNTIRPLSMEVPALPDAVHGSALFTRGESSTYENQVGTNLCCRKKIRICL